MPFTQAATGRTVAIITACIAAIAPFHSAGCFCEAAFLSSAAGSPRPAFAAGPPPRVRGSAFRPSSSPSRLHGISEWRDQCLLASCEAAGTNTATAVGNDVILQGGGGTSSHPTEVCILPFPYTDVLLQGETVELHLYEDRFVSLFRDVVNKHCGIVGMGLLAGAGLITTMPLCHVEAFSDMSGGEGQDTGGGLGVFVTLRAVGRAKIVDALTQEEPYVRGLVVEIEDEVPPFLEVPSIVADNIENFFISISSMEHDLRKLSKGEKDEDGMKRRMVNSQLESLFLNNDDEERTILDDDATDDCDDETEVEETSDRIEDDCDDETEVEEASDLVEDRSSQFQSAYQNAVSTDNQGYVVTQSSSASPSSEKNNNNAAVRSAEDLVAISWAAFCTGRHNNSHKDEGSVGGEGAEKRDVQRIQALDCTNLMKRLQLASKALCDEKEVLKTKLAIAGGAKDKRKMRREDDEPAEEG